MCVSSPPPPRPTEIQTSDIRWYTMNIRLCHISGHSLTHTQCISTAKVNQSDQLYPSHSIFRLQATILVLGQYNYRIFSNAHCPSFPVLVLSGSSPGAELGKCALKTYHKQGSCKKKPASASKSIYPVHQQYLGEFNLLVIGHPNAEWSAASANASK